MFFFFPEGAFCLRGVLAGGWFWPEIFFSGGGFLSEGGFCPERGGCPEGGF